MMSRICIRGQLQHLQNKHRNGALQFSLCSILKPGSHESIKIIRFLERKAPLVYSKVIEDITWPRGETKFLFEC